MFWQSVKCENRIQSTAYNDTYDDDDSPAHTVRTGYTKTPPPINELLTAGRPTKNNNHAQSLSGYTF